MSIKNCSPATAAREELKYLNARYDDDDDDPVSAATLPYVIPPPRRRGYAAVYRRRCTRRRRPRREPRVTICRVKRTEILKNKPKKKKKTPCVRPALDLRQQVGHDTTRTSLCTQIHVVIIHELVENGRVYSRKRAYRGGVTTFAYSVSAARPSQSV